MEFFEVIDRLKKIRTRKGLSARELSLNINKNVTYINRLEHRKDFVPTITAINDIAEACDSSLEELFYYDIDSYKIDKEIIEVLKNTPADKKKAMLELFKK